MYYIFKISDKENLKWYIITNEQEICVSKISTKLQDCIRNLNNPNGYNRGKIIHEIYTSKKEIICTFKHVDEIIDLIPEEFL